MRILVDRFIYQGLRYVSIRHAARDQLIYRTRSADKPSHSKIRIKRLTAQTRPQERCLEIMDKGAGGEGADRHNAYVDAAHEAVLDPPTNPPPRSPDIVSVTNDRYAATWTPLGEYPRYRHH